MRHILVTGGGGYVGGQLVPRLLDRGFRVRVLDRFWFSDPKGLGEHPRLQVVQADIRDSCKLRESLFGVDTVIHLATITEQSAPHLSSDLLTQINGQAHERLVEGAARRGVRRFVFLSSTSIYGNPEDGEVTEDQPVRPGSAYGRLLWEAEQAVLRRASRDTFSSTVLRAAPVWGRSQRMRRELPLNRVIHDSLLGGPVEMPAANRIQPSLYLQDLVDLLVRTAEIPSDLMAGQIFNACGANPTWGEIARALARVAPIQPQFGPPLSPGAAIAASRVRQRLGFSPRTSLETGLEVMASATHQRMRASEASEAGTNRATGWWPSV